ncbi:uncharacterized protein N7482_003120 [Penicillium canariense]|uniref:Uncharacterized protein n=1 Tax=Penicillium canariense TaxID=189055 RepID=A0A9W9LUJ5_9EURO|nr:uncharacterized protein N7482_003120 [Penicillium canariense]KAJ5177243.1 hypothetical protein N7482_003120 [Penicillium canariense]
MSARSWLQTLPRKQFFNTLYRCNIDNHVRNGFLTSSSAGLLNPRQNMLLSSDTVWQDFDAEMLAGMNDQKILASFTEGFFGGFVFGIEGILLRAGAWRVLPVYFTRFPQSRQSPELWKNSELSKDDLCAVGTKLFGIFQLLDKHVSESQARCSSYVDYGFGSDNYSFAGCHRFSVTRFPSLSGAPVGAENPKCQIRISLEGFICNPQHDKSWIPELGKRFHALYARALFANAVQAIFNNRPLV